MRRIFLACLLSFTTSASAFAGQYSYDKKAVVDFGVALIPGEKLTELISAGLSMPAAIRDKLRPILLPGS